MQNDAENVEIQLHVLVTLISMHFYFKKRDKPANQYANKSGPQIHKLFCYFWKHSIHNSFDSNPLSYQRVSKRVLWENICWACKYFCEQIKYFSQCPVTAARWRPAWRPRCPAWTSSWPRSPPPAPSWRGPTSASSTASCCPR